MAHLVGQPTRRKEPSAKRGTDWSLLPSSFFSSNASSRPSSTFCARRTTQLQHNKRHGIPRYTSRRSRRRRIWWKGRVYSPWRCVALATRKLLQNHSANARNRTRWYGSFVRTPRYCLRYALSIKRFDDLSLINALEMGTFVHDCENEMFCQSINTKIPYFNAPIYLENKVHTAPIHCDCWMVGKRKADTIYRHPSAKSTRSSAH
jgi:hypothetical protein